MLDNDSAAYAYLRDQLRGASAKSIAAHLGRWGQQDGAYPVDADDFGRCEALLEAVPEFRARLGEMEQVNAYWAALAPIWDDLRGIAPEARTAAMKKVLRPIEDADPGHVRMSDITSIRAGSSITFSHEQYKSARAAKEGRVPMKETAEDVAVRDHAYSVTADELRQFVERYEHLESEKKDITDQQKEVMAEAKGRGYDVKAIRKLIALRKRKPDEIAEEQAVLDLYLQALGME